MPHKDRAENNAYWRKWRARQGESYRAKMRAHSKRWAANNPEKLKENRKRAFAKLKASGYWRKWRAAQKANASPRVFKSKYSLKDPDGRELHGPDRDKARRKLADPKIASQSWKRYYESHKLELRAKVNVWRKNNAERLRAYRKKYYAAVDVKRRQSDLEYRTRKNAHVKKWMQKHPAKVSAIQRRRRMRLKLAVRSDKHADAFYLFVRSQKKIPCYYCGKSINGKDAHIDHVIALSKSGNHASDNLCCSCEECNLRKFDKLPSEISFLDQPILNL